MTNTNESDTTPSTPFKSGMVSIVGRPNVGKSTLVNVILGEKIAIVSNIPQTTRNPIRGIYTDERGQIVFIDTPGLHLGRDNLDRYMFQSSVDNMSDVDCVIHLTDTSEPVGEEEHNVVEKLSKLSCPVIVGLNKVDLRGKFIPQYIELWEQMRGCPVTEMSNITLLPLSGKEGTHIEKLLDILFEKLPEGPALYPHDVITDLPQRMAVSDIIREKLFHVMKKEVPHSIGVIVEEMAPRKGKVMYVRAVIMVERDTQKIIVVGRKGEVLKVAGQAAREELEDMLGQKVFVELYVKVQKNWRDDHSALGEMGYMSYE